MCDYIYIYIYICDYINIYMRLYMRGVLTFVKHYIYIYIYNVSQKLLHPSYFCRYLSISFHGSTLTN